MQACKKMAPFLNFRWQTGPAQGKGPFENRGLPILRHQLNQFMQIQSMLKRQHWSYPEKAKYLFSYFDALHTPFIRSHPITNQATENDERSLCRRGHVHLVINTAVRTIVLPAPPVSHRESQRLLSRMVARRDLGRRWEVGRWRLFGWTERRSRRDHRVSPGGAPRSSPGEGGPHGPAHCEPDADGPPDRRRQIHKCAPLRGVSHRRLCCRPSTGGDHRRAGFRDEH